LTDNEPHEFETGGPSGAPRFLLRRLLRALAVLIIVVVLGSLAVARGLPDGTNASSLVIRGAVGLAIGLALIFVVRRMIGALIDPPPPAPERVDARRADVTYECPVCGTRVRLEVAATTKAPRHCGEEMEASVG
jgi:hypothetical protein